MMGAIMKDQDKQAGQQPEQRDDADKQQAKPSTSRGKTFEGRGVQKQKG